MKNARYSDETEPTFAVMWSSYAKPTDGRDEPAEAVDFAIPARADVDAARGAAPVSLRGAFKSTGKLLSVNAATGECAVRFDGATIHCSADSLVRA